MGRCAEAAGTRLSHVRLDVDDDARLCARVVLEPAPRLYGIMQYAQACEQP